MSRRRIGGFTLLELMIAMALGVVILTAMAGLFTASLRSHRQDEQSNIMQGELRYALSQLMHDLELASFWTDLSRPEDQITIELGPSDIATDCGAGGARWASDDNESNVRQMRIFDSSTATPSTGSDVNAQFGCIGTDEFYAGGDVIALKKVLGRKIHPITQSLPCIAGSESAPSTMTADGAGVFLRSNGLEARLFKFSGSGSIPKCFDYWQYLPTVWYIRDYTDTDGDGIPSLCRKVLSRGTVTMTTECLAQGVENIQFEFGLDTDADGIPDVYRSRPTGVVPEDATAVRVHILMRSLKPITDYRNEKVYTLGNYSFDPPAATESYYRRSLSTMVLMRNRMIARKLP